MKYISAAGTGLYCYYLQKFGTQGRVGMRIVGDRVDRRRNGGQALGGKGVHSDRLNEVINL